MKSPAEQFREFIENQPRYDVLKLKPWEYQFLKNYLTDAQRQQYEAVYTEGKTHASSH